MPERSDSEYETPGQPHHDGVEIGEAHKIGATQYQCPNCHATSIERSFEECPACGLKLLWRDGNSEK
jgi:predicted RNA-binding Zn-ribbon protein involved in translation (DUF1610 family)